MSDLEVTEPFEHIVDVSPCPLPLVSHCRYNAVALHVRQPLYVVGIQQGNPLTKRLEALLGHPDILPVELRCRLLTAARLTVVPSATVRMFRGASCDATLFVDSIVDTPRRGRESMPRNPTRQARRLTGGDLGRARLRAPQAKPCLSQASSSICKPASLAAAFILKMLPAEVGIIGRRYTASRAEPLLLALLIYGLAGRHLVGR